jgi:hypothetical protein
MKKTNIIIGKSLSLIMSVGILGTYLPVQAVYATTNPPKTQIQQSNTKNGVLYEDNTFKVTETDNSRTVLDKKTNHKVVLTFTDSKHSKGIYKDANGNEKKFFTDASGSIYLDNKCIIQSTRSTVPVKSGIHLDDYTNDDYFTGDDGFTYYYVTTNTYSTKVTGDAESLALDLLGFVPYVGPIFGVAGAIETVRSFGADTMYVVEEEYCTSDYSHYAYKNYFYSDRAHDNLVDSNVVYKTMF